jgi:hypothetical protein
MYRSVYHVYTLPQSSTRFSFIFIFSFLFYSLCFTFLLKNASGTPTVLYPCRNPLDGQSVVYKGAAHRKRIKSMSDATVKSSTHVYLAKTLGHWKRLLSYVRL